MKILFFILGSIDNRITSWGTEGFRPVLEEDIVFYGPIPENNYSFEGKNIPIVKVFDETSIEDLLKSLPNEWYPDIITCETSTINLIPDIYKSPVKTYHLARDAWVDTMYNKGIVELFDFIRYNVIDRDTYYAYNTTLLPLSNTSVSIPNKDVPYKSFGKREIDILAIANYNDAFYHKRYKLFFDLAKNLNNSFRIKFVTGLEKDQIHDYYRKAKIIIDWAHTLSNRSYESALNGCLLFSHEDNKLISEFWEPWKEFIPFNDSNLIELLQHYLKDEKHSAQIVENTTIKAQEVPTSYGESILNHLKIAIDSNVKPNDRIQRIHNLSPITVYHRIATPLYFNYHFSHYNIPENWKELYFERINKSLAFNDSIELKIPVLLEAMRFSFLLNNLPNVELYSRELEKTVKDYGWIYYHKAFVEIESNNFEQAIFNFNEAIEYAKQNPDILEKYVLPFAQKGNTCDIRRVTDYLWSSYNSKNDQLNALLHLCYKEIAEVYLKMHNTPEAIKNLENAILTLSIPSTIHRLLDILFEKAEYSNMLKYAKIGLDDSPYDTKTNMYFLVTIIITKRRSEAKQFAKKYSHILKCFQGSNKMLFLRNLLMLLYYSNLLNTKLTVLILKRIILKL